MGAVEYPEFLKKLPEANIKFEGMKAWLLQSESGQVVLFHSDVEAEVNPHSHGNQWGIVIDSKIDLRIGDKTKTYEAGDSYFIPAGVEHEGKVHPGFKAIDIFEEKDRYQPK
ncbi:MAG: cupin domain-containing protein [Planctomycetota bacterium]|jgi:quercetin dioxygenase-like cupin family protein